MSVRSGDVFEKKKAEEQFLKLTSLCSACLWLNINFVETQIEVLG